MDGQSKQRTVPLDHLPGRASRLVGRDEMQEIRFHGRGGQGTVLAAIALAKAFFTAGYEVQTFPVFGSERRGAPVEAYLRLDDRKILVRSNVYAPDHVMVQDLHLLGIVQVTRGLKPGGWILLNAPELPRDLGPFEGFRLAHVDAAAIALAFARMLGAPPLDAVTEAIRDAMPRKPEQNMAAARDAYAAVVLAGPVRDGRLALAAGAGFLEGGR
jgi:pyruvate ferredoxin oxidoreductase gamma subunit/2-oxoisovalerate ferredoxin oxidoreductase gamma subunit